MTANPSLAPLALIALLAAGTVSAQDAAATAAATIEPLVLGKGKHRYEWMRGWGHLPKDAKTLGNTHGCIAVDAKGRVFVNTDMEHAVVIYNQDGSIAKTWGKEFKGGLHGMTIVREGDDEFVYLAHTGRSEVIKTTVAGKVLWTLGYPKEAGIYKQKKQFRPTGVAVAPNGDVYVADGYGLSWVHQFDKNRNYIRSWGGRGKDRDQYRTPHGIRLDTRGEEPVLVVCDRENNRLKIHALDGKLVQIVHGMLRRPCNTYQHGSDIVVADLAGRVTILNAKNELVTHLGDQPEPKMRAKNGIPKEKWKDGEFLSPHGAAFDAAGNLYVMDWNRWGRVTKLKRLGSE